MAVLLTSFTISLLAQPQVQWPRARRAHPRNEFLQKLIGVRKHRKVTAIDGHKLFEWSFDCAEILLCERSRTRKILGSLEEKHGHSKLEPELLRRFGPHLGHEAFSAQILAIERIVQISHGITKTNQSKAKGPAEESIRSFETVRPLALYAVALTVRVRWWANAARFARWSVS
jgi:hypothetical protein